MMQTLVDQVDKLVQTQKSNLLATTPTTVAVSELATRVDSLERALREIALEVEKLAGANPHFWKRQLRDASAAAASRPARRAA